MILKSAQMQHVHSYILLIHHSILWFITYGTGNRGMGALEFEPVNPKGTESSTKLEISGLIDIARDILNNRQNFNTDLSDNKEKALLDIIKTGTSAGGPGLKL